MKLVGVHNIKGGVGKTAAAVNLGYVAATLGLRTLLWDMDPQGAASFYFRVKPKVRGGAKALLERKRDPREAIKGTDFALLDLLPADFSNRNLDLILEAAGKPQRRVRRLLKPLREDYDLVLLDCAPGITLSAESVFHAVDRLLVPTIPTILSLRTLEQLAKFCKDPESGQPALSAFFSMTDRRKKLHRAIVQRPPRALADFLQADVPYASEVERMGVERAPLGAFAPQGRAARAYLALWDELAERMGLPQAG